MNSFELNKIVGAILVTALAATVIGHLGDILVPVDEGGHEGAGVEMASAGGGEGEAGGAPAEEQVASLPVRLADATVEDGESVSRRCASCHTFEQGGPNRVGPNLHGVVGRERGSVEGFNYSGGLANKGGTWDYASLDTFLDNPSDFVDGTKMSFRLKDPEDRANIIAYLKSISPDAPPLPEPQQQAEAESEAAEAGEQAAAEGEEQPAAEEGAGEQMAEEDGGQQATAEDGEEAGADEGGELASVFADASAEEGEKYARRCSACHTFDEGGANRVGPNLHGVVGRERGAVEGYNYSRGLREMGGEWDYASLFEYLADPRGFAEGAKMTFKVPKEEDRADVIAYLKSISPGAPPLPGKDE